jgi:hypothetical protein
MIGAIGGRERIKSNWEGIDKCTVIECTVISLDALNVLINKFSLHSACQYIPL